jgi:hypothetical protein
MQSKVLRFWRGCFSKALNVANTRKDGRPAAVKLHQWVIYRLHPPQLWLCPIKQAKNCIRNNISEFYGNRPTDTTEMFRHATLLVYPRGASIAATSDSTKLSETAVCTTIHSTDLSLVVTKHKYKTILAFPYRTHQLFRTLKEIKMQPNM